MSSKFSPKFTIATAYPMMYSSSDLKYIESDMLDMISADTTSSPSEPLEASHHSFWDAIETATDFYAWVKHDESRRQHTLKRLESLWKHGSEDSPRQ
jgi:hypothetical protein